jgi:hypothetical protein
MDDGYRGFPAFLANAYAGPAREQLLYTLEYKSIMSGEEIDEALKAKPGQMSVEEEEEKEDRVQT